MTTPTLRPLSFGEILDGAFTLYRRNFMLFIGTSLLLTLGLIATIFVIGGTGGAMAEVMPGAMSVMVTLLVGVAIAAVAMVLWGALTWQASESYVGKPVSLSEGMNAGGRAAMTLVGAGILAFLAFVLMMIGVLLVAVLLGVIVGALGIPALAVAVALLTGLGLLAALCFVAALFFAVVPAVVVEEKGPVEAISRSLQLANGALPRITGMMLVTLLITYLPIMAVLMLTGGFEGMLSQAAAQAAGQSAPANLVQQLLTWLVSLLTTPFMFSVIVLLYYDRRVRTEALDVHMLTEKLGLATA